MPEKVGRPTDNIPSNSQSDRYDGLGERRQATALFADLVGFTAFSERSGEEAAYSLMQRISALMTDAIHEEGGTVRSFTGDGIMALFGVPIALEDAPLRACRAALDIQQRISSAAAEIETKYGLRPWMRIGINTGPMIVGEMRSGASTSVTAIGDTVNLASRLQSLAEPGGVLLSEATHRLVQGLVQCGPAGEYEIKGKAERQKAFHLDRVRPRAARFDAALSRGLTNYVGRSRELKTLNRALERATDTMVVIDVVGEPGIGKSRLVHEFRGRLADERLFVLSGSCTPDGQQTPFLPLIDIVRGPFQLGEEETENDIARKLEKGLGVLGLASEQNLALLLNLLGLKPKEGALKGLDGVLIGLRTRDLLIRLLQERRRITPVVMILEDLHWIDSVSEELIARLVNNEEKIPLLIVYTRRPEYRLPGMEPNSVTEILLGPLSAADTSLIVRERLGVADLPTTLNQLVTSRAEGNPLFAEEIASYLNEHGMVRSRAGVVEYNAEAVAAALPGSIQALLTARIDGLAPPDRALLQAAAVVGRLFAPDLLSAISGTSPDVDAQLSAMQALDLVYEDEKSGELVFKHALVRDALYDSLLSGPRMALHLKVAAEVERRSANRLVEVAETLAYHYGCTASADKAFRYLAMAAKKSLDIYALEEAERYFQRALQLAEADPGCVSDLEFADMLVDFARLLNSDARVKQLTDVLERHLSRIEAVGDTGYLVLVLHHYSFALQTRAQFGAAHEVGRRCMEVAERVGDNRSMAYGQSSFIQTSTTVSPLPLQVFEKLGREALQLSDKTDDTYLRAWVLFILAWDYFNRGLTREARQYADRLLTAARNHGDPRATGLGLWLLGWVDIFDEQYGHAVAHADECIRTALTPMDRSIGMQVKGVALALNGKLDEGLAILRPLRNDLLANDWRYNLSGTDLALSMATVLAGAFSRGERLCEKYVHEQEAAGYQAAADWGRINLAEVYLEMLSSEQRPPLQMILRNAVFLLRLKFSGRARIKRLLQKAGENTQFSERGILRARVEFGLGRLYCLQRRTVLAKDHLARAKRAAEQLRADAMLARINKLEQTFAGSG